MKKGKIVITACVMTFFLACEHSGRFNANHGTLVYSESEQNSILAIIGSIECGMKIVSTATKVSEKLQGDNSKIKKKKSGEPSPPYLSKTDATLDLLLSLRGKEQVPQEMRKILMRHTVSVSVRFAHELTTLEIMSIEEYGVEFVRLPNGTIAHSGSIYGAKLPWDKVYNFSKFTIVVRIESEWQPGVQKPSTK